MSSFFRLSGVLLALALGAAFAGPATAATKIRLTMQLPVTSPLTQNLYRFKERVEAVSDGDIQIEIYPAAQLYTDKEVPTAVASGQIEMGVSVLLRFAGTIPAVDIFSVPFLFNSTELVRAATAPGSPVRTPLDEAMIAKGARPLWWQPYGLSLLVTRGKLVKRPEDMRGLKIRTFGKAMEAFVNTIGGAATNIAASRQFLAYERGTVDGGMTGMLTVRDRKLYEVLDELTLTNHSDLELVVVINERFWEGLKQRERDILAHAARDVEAELRDEFPRLEAEATRQVRAEGVEIHQLSADELAAWVAASAPLRKAFVETAGPLGAQLLAAADGLRANLGK